MFVIKTKDLGAGGISASDSELTAWNGHTDHEAAAYDFVRNVIGSDLPKVGGVLTDVGIQWHVFDCKPDG